MKHTHKCDACRERFDCPDEEIGDEQCEEELTEDGGKVLCEDCQ